MFLSHCEKFENLKIATNFPDKSLSPDFVWNLPAAGRYFGVHSSDFNLKIEANINKLAHCFF